MVIYETIFILVKNKERIPGKYKYTYLGYFPYIHMYVCIYVKKNYRCSKGTHKS